MECKIRFTELDMAYARSYWECFCSVVKENQYFTFRECFPFEETIGFLQKTYDFAVPFVMAIDEATDEVIGWCDVQMQSEKVGTLGMGIHKNYRGNGIGKKLITKALEAARSYKYEVIFLRARHTNDRAIGLYKKIGFIETNYIKCSVPNGGENEDKYFDIVEMELIL